MPYHPAEPVVVEMSWWERTPWGVYDRPQWKNHYTGPWVSGAGVENAICSGELYVFWKQFPALCPSRDGLLDYRTPSDQATRTAHLELVLSDHQVILSDGPSTNHHTMHAAHQDQARVRLESTRKLHKWAGPHVAHHCSSLSAHMCGPLEILYDQLTEEGKALFGS